jgi:DNA-binding NtrC family response regulator
MSKKLMAAILIIGNDSIALRTRADLLRGWQVSTATSANAARKIRSRAHDLIIIGQTISDAAAKRLIDRARKMNPDVIVLAI